MYNLKPVGLYFMIENFEENLGNVKIRPSKVHLDIYDSSHQKLLRSGDITEMDWVDPFAIRQVEGQMPFDLGLGEYWADVTVYKEGESLGISKVHFRVVPRTEKPAIPLGEKGKEFILLYWPYIGIGIILLIIVLIFVWIEREKLKIAPKGKKRTVKRKRKRSQAIKT